MGAAGLAGVTELPPAWPQGFVVGGDQGYLGIFKMDSKAEVDSVGTFRMPGQKAHAGRFRVPARDVRDNPLLQVTSISKITVAMLSSGQDSLRMLPDVVGIVGWTESSLVILSFEEHETEAGSKKDGLCEEMGTTRARARAAAAPQGSPRSALVLQQGGPRGGALVARPRPPTEKWSLHTFPMTQADLAATGQVENFTPVFQYGTHHGLITAIKPAFSRRVMASCAEDRTLKLWNFPTEEQEALPMPFTPELSLQVSNYEHCRSLAMHPLGFQVACILEESPFGE
eukprot:Skav206551  [mRNA]  locus=scaffold547:52437:66589:- [translate_table: standard]